MSITGNVVLPDGGASDGVDDAGLGVPQHLEQASWYFSAFLLCFPIITIVGTYITEKIILLSLPLLLMAVCGAFGLRFSYYLEKTP